MTIAYPSADQVEGAQDVTILIASFNRSEQIVPLINYYLDFGFHVNVAYDSDKPILLDHQRLSLHRLSESYSSRCEFLSRNIHSNFGILVTDDDLFVADEIIRMKSLLEGSDSISVFGQVVGSWFDNGSFQVSPTYLPFESYANFEKDVSKRVLNQFTCSGITPISMYRLTYSVTLSKMLQLFGKLEFVSTPYIYEVSAEIFMNYAGTSFRSSGLYWIRNWEAASISNSKWNRSLSFLEWFNHAGYVKERFEWLETIKIFCPGLDIAGLESVFQANWIEQLSSREESKQLRTKWIGFTKRLQDFIKHRFTGYYSIQNLDKKVSWEYEPDSIAFLLKTLYTNQIRN